MLSCSGEILRIGMSLQMDIGCRDQTKKHKMLSMKASCFSLLDVSRVEFADNNLCSICFTHTRARLIKRLVSSKFQRCHMRLKIERHFILTLQTQFEGVHRNHSVFSICSSVFQSFYPICPCKIVGSVTFTFMDGLLSNLEQIATWNDVLEVKIYFGVQMSYSLHNFTSMNVFSI